MNDIFTEVKNRLFIKDVVEHYAGVTFDRSLHCHCPLPNHHDVKSPSFSILEKANTFKCFGCDKSGSVIDFVMLYKNVDKIEAVKMLNSDFNLNLELNDKEAMFDIKGYIKRCIRDIDKTDYFIKRGLSQETIRRHQLGYDLDKKQVVIPYSGKLNYYQARSIIDKRFFKPQSDVAGIEPIYNENRLLQNLDEPIFVVESPICAMSIEQYNAYAIATCGGNGISKLDKLIAKNKHLSFIISMDNDDAGTKFANELSKYLKDKRIKHIIYNIAGKEKDPNDLLQKSSDFLIKNIIKAKQQFYKDNTNYGDLKSANELLGTQFAPTPWYVKDLFTNGLTLICGASKSGKSWFVQQLCLAICSNSLFLKQPTTKSSCWYMALEDDEQLSKERLMKMLKQSSAPDGFYISHEIYPMDKVEKDKPTLMEYIKENIKRNHEIKVIVIDTFQKIRSSALYGESMYAHDYRDISTLKKLADELHIAIIVIHHTNKMKDRDTDGDEFAKISGTNGLMGSADCIVLLNKKRNESNAKLSFIGRKIKGDNWEIIQDENTMTWDKIGTVEEETQKRIRKEYEQDPYVVTIKVLLKEHDNCQFSITATKFLEECCRIYGHMPNKNPNILAKELNDLTFKLKDYDGIIHLSPNKNGGANGRPHTFYFMGKKQEQIALS